MERSIFGTDGVRGQANRAPMDSETALGLGRALATHISVDGRRHSVVIGKDTRLSGYMIETALASGICSMGVDVMLVGPLPTPGIAFITRSMRADAGVVISASHNKYSDNGIKFFNRDGYKLCDEVELKIEKIFKSLSKSKERPSGDEIGRAKRIDDATGRYIQFLKGSFPGNLNLNGMRIVVDCANGAGYKVAPEIFEELGAEIITLGTEPDGININEDCGSLCPSRMQKLVVQVGADVGIALDGDADRVIMCDENGKLIDGDVIMSLAALDLKRRNLLQSDTLVATVMSNLALDEALGEYGINVVRTKVGDRYVLAEMQANGYNLGGEQSGHMIFLDYSTTGDGTLAAMQILGVMVRDEKPLSELASIFEPYPQVSLSVKVSRKREFTAIPEIAKAMENFKYELGSAGRLVMRFSGTEDIARVMVEGRDSTRVRSIASDLAGLINTHLGI